MKAARKFVADTLREQFPKWRVIDNHATVDALDRITVFVAVTAVGRSDAAPMGAYDTTVTLTLASPKADNVSAAEDELEDALEALVLVIEDHFGTAWDEATKVTFQNTYLAWDVPVHVITSRKDD